MHVSTWVRRSIALLGVLAAASACSDAPSAPRAAEHPPFDVTALQPLDARGGPDARMHDPRTGPADAPRGGPRADQSDTENTLSITIDPNVSRTYAFGENWIYFPAHSICDPATSGYGVTLWDSPCDAINRPITVTVHWSSKGGHAYARFEPEIRFVPADAHSYSRWVILSLHDQKRLHDINDYNILYYGGQTIGWINEQLQDPTLTAWVDRATNSVYRRVKHFSGYMLAAGYTGGLGDASY